MKTIITLLTATVLVAGATGAMAADRQGSDEATNNNLSWQAARSGAYASARIPSGARASVRVPVQAGAAIFPGAIGFTADRDPAQFRN